MLVRFLLFALCIAISATVHADRPAELPDAAPLFAATVWDMHDRSFDLATLRGKPLVVNFWARWCGPCRVEFPELVELRNNQTDPRFRFISASYSHAPGDPQLRQQTAAFLKSQQFVLPVHQDPQFAAAQALLKLSGEQNFSFPTTVLLDQQGVIRSIWIGYRPGIAKEMRQRVDELLK